MQNKIIAFDLDGVLANFHFSFSLIANGLFGTPVIKDINEVRKYRWQDYTSITSKQVSEVWRKIDESNIFWENLDSLINEDTSKRLINLSNDNTLFFVTARKHKRVQGCSIIKQTNKWINKNLDGLTGYSVIPTFKKGHILNAIEANYFIDDNVENIIEVSNDAPNCKSFLLVRPYNAYAIEFFKNSRRYKNFNIVYSVEDFLNEIN